MQWEFDNAGARRLLIAAGISLALHAAIVLSIGRDAGIDGPLYRSPVATPLMARLVNAVTESVLQGQLPADSTPAEPAERAQSPQAEPSPAPSDSAATAPGSLYYFKASELDRRPFPLTRVDVPVPESGDAVAGSMMIRLRISESGRVDDAKIVMGTGIAEFEASALREFLRTQFHPGYRGNLPVRSEMLIEVTLLPPTGGG